jgi:multidrug efflux pump
MMPEVQQKLADVSGIRILPITPPALPGGGQFPVEFVIASTADSEEIYQYALKVEQMMRESGSFPFQVIDMKVDQPEYQLNIDRDKVADLGLNMRDVVQDLGTLLGGGYVNRFNMDGQSYKVIWKVKSVSGTDIKAWFTALP